MTWCWRVASDSMAGVRKIRSPDKRSDPQIAVLHLGGRGQLGGGAAPHHTATLDQVVMVGEPGERSHVLVDYQDRLAPGPELAEAAPDFLADQRRQPFRGLIEDQQA